MHPNKSLKPTPAKGMPGQAVVTRHGERKSTPLVLEL
jgi:hypothetical protein